MKDADFSRSLDAFFYERQPADLSNCDREPVHFVGAAQAEGALLIVMPGDGTVVASSENLAAQLGREVPPFPCRLEAVLPEQASELREAAGRSNHQHILLRDMVHAPGGDFQAVYHEHREYGFVELVPDGDMSVPAYREKLRILRRFCARIMQATTFDEALALTAEAGRALTGFARVKIYEFQPDWSGKVVAESKADHMPSYKGLLFPDSDIPQQARFLMKMVPYRGIASVHDNVSALTPPRTPAKEPFDLSWSVLRSVSTMHTLYLRNMGVAASFSASLVSRGQLWGLIACHNDKPGFLPFDLWGAVQDLAEALMAKLEQVRSIDEAALLSELRSIEEQVADVVRSKGSVEKSVADVLPHLRTFLKADGFAFQYGTNLYTEGEVPPDELIQELLDWATTKVPGTTFLTNRLADEWPAARAFKDVACGVLIEPVSLHRVCHLIWFRTPVTKTAHWAGNPTKMSTRAEADGTATLLPRNSFAVWAQQHADESEPWTEAEVSAAREILKSVLDIVASQLQLTRSNTNLETFAYAAAHDLKTPLRHIGLVLQMLRAGELEDEAETMKMLDLAAASSERLHSLVESLLKYLALQSKKVEMTDVHLDEVMTEVARLLGPALSDAAATLDAAALPTVKGNRELLTTLLMNLVGNALKYREPSRALHISVRGSTLHNRYELAVADNGPGVPTEHAKSIFEPLKRLHRYQDVPGTGLGLAVCQRIAELHHGTIALDTEYPAGARFLVRLKK